MKHAKDSQLVRALPVKSCPWAAGMTERFRQKKTLSLKWGHDGRTLLERLEPRASSSDFDDGSRSVTKARDRPTMPPCPYARCAEVCVTVTTASAVAAVAVSATPPRRACPLLAASTAKPASRTLKRDR